MKKLTFKQKNFAKEYVKNNGNATQAVMKSYNIKDRSIAQPVGSENLLKPIVKEEIESILNSEGLSNREITKSLRTNIEAGLGQKATASDSLRGIEMALKLQGAFPATKSAHLNIDISERYKDSSYKDILTELKNTRQTTERLLTDLGSS